MSNIIMTRFEPLLRLHFSRKKKMVLKEERPTIAKSETTGFKAVVWKCATSAPDVTVVLYNPGGSPIYQVSRRRVFAAVLLVLNSGKFFNISLFQFEILWFMHVLHDL